MPEDSPFRVAVVGGGMGGATAAYYLRQFFGPQVSITLFEQSGRIGGRIRAVDFGGRKCETGASIFHSCNQYMKKFSEKFDLPLRDVSKGDNREVFYGGHEKVAFSTLGGPPMFVKMRYFWHFGFDAIRGYRYTRSMMRDFTKIYKLQDDGFCFSTPAQLLAALRPEFVEMTTQTFDDWLTKRVKVGTVFKEELAYPLVCNNFCQNLDVHGFVGFITLSTMLPKLYMVTGGNEQVPSNLVRHALADNPADGPKKPVRAKVTTISRVPSSGGFKVEYMADESSQKYQETFDYVVLAAPMHQDSEIRTDGTITLPRNQYQPVDHGFFVGSLKCSAFGITKCPFAFRQLIGIIPTQSGYLKDPGCLFRTFMSFPTKPGSTSRLWTTFSVPSRVADPIKSFTEKYFERLEYSADGKPSALCFRWLAYPVYKPVANPAKDLGSFVIAPGLFYVNAIEQAASCMEMAAIGGRNAALLVAAARQSSLGQAKTVHVDTIPTHSSGSRTSK